MNILQNKAKAQNRTIKHKIVIDDSKSVKTTNDLIEESKIIQEDTTPRSKKVPAKKTKNFGDRSFRSPPRGVNQENYMSLSSTMPPSRVSAGSRSDVKNRSYMTKRKNVVSA